MKNYSERTQDILHKAEKKKLQRRHITTIASSLTCLALCVSLALLWHPGQPDTYSNSEYAKIIEKLETFQPSLDGSNSIWDSLVGVNPDPPAAVPDEDVNMTPSLEFGTNAEQITDNQVAGVGEADRIQRTGKHIFFLRGNRLHIYTIAGNASAEAGSFLIEDSCNLSRYARDREMYLSPDGSTITILSPVYNYDEGQKYTMVLSLDVANPEHIQENGRMYMVGNYLSSRFIDGELYVINQYRVSPEYIKFADPTTFVPYYGTPKEKICIPGEKIFAPEEVVNSSYTTVYKLDGKVLKMLDSAAYLSYSTELFVSNDSIYLTRSFTETATQSSKTIRTAKTEISRLHYASGVLSDKGSAVIEGRILNQYSMDQKDNILRVVTTIDQDCYYEQTDGEYTSMRPLENVLSASLYCIDLNTWETVADVESFAPQGEEVRSVRFDGDSAYVCTSVVLTDPVFFFDLSDLNSITWKDTGTIDGYSLSLVDFAEGYLMGIGYGSSFDTLKIELYQEGDSTIESLCKYELPGADFSQEYKAYYIDRGNRLIGLAVLQYALNKDATQYLLFHFDGYELNRIASVPINGDCDLIRGVYIDGFLYVLGDTLEVKEIK